MEHTECQPSSTYPNKDKLKAKVDTIPIFEMRDVSISEEPGQWSEGSVTSGEFQPNAKAVCEVTGSQAVCFASNRYNLVQFKDIFLPILNNIDNDVDGKILYYNGSAVMDIFPEDSDYQDNGTKFGIVVLNSVNLTTSVSIRFAVEHKGKPITFPQSMAGFKRTHLNRNVGNIAKSYGTVVAKIKNEWEAIVDGFPKIEVDAQLIKDLVNDEKLGFSDYQKKWHKNKFLLALADGKKYNVWNFFEHCIDYVGSRNYKTDLHKRQQMDKLVAKILEYGFLSKL
jgi:hypothetical protein